MRDWLSQRANAVQALIGLVLLTAGVACQFGVWYGAIVAGGSLMLLAVLDNMR